MSFRETSCRENIPSGKWPVGETTRWGNVLAGNVFRGNVLYGKRPAPARYYQTLPAFSHSQQNIPSLNFHMTGRSVPFRCFISDFILVRKKLRNWTPLFRSAVLFRMLYRPIRAIRFTACNSTVQYIVDCNFYTVTSWSWVLPWKFKKHRQFNFLM